MVRINKKREKVLLLNKYDPERSRRKDLVLDSSIKKPEPLLFDRESDSRIPHSSARNLKKYNLPLSSRDVKKQLSKKEKAKIKEEYKYRSF